MHHTLSVEPTGESHGHCDCCGNVTRTVWGFVQDAEKTIAAYFVHWTVGSAEHLPNFDLLIGTWGNDQVHDRVLSAWLYNPAENSFMIIDASRRPRASVSLCSHALSREETLAMPQLKAIASDCLDAVWLHEKRIAEIRAFADDA